MSENNHQKGRLAMSQGGNAAHEVLVSAILKQAEIYLTVRICQCGAAEYCLEVMKSLCETLAIVGVPPTATQKVEDRLKEGLSQLIERHGDVSPVVNELLVEILGSPIERLITVLRDQTSQPIEQQEILYGC